MMLCSWLWLIHASKCSLKIRGKDIGMIQYIRSTPFLLWRGLQWKVTQHTLSIHCLLLLTFSSITIQQVNTSFSFYSLSTTAYFLIFYNETASNEKCSHHDKNLSKQKRYKTKITMCWITTSCSVLPRQNVVTCCLLCTIYSLHMEHILSIQGGNLLINVHNTNPLGRANAHRVDSTKIDNLPPTQLKVKSLNFTGVNKHYQLSELKDSNIQYLKLRCHHRFIILMTPGWNCKGSSLCRLSINYF